MTWEVGRARERGRKGGKGRCLPPGADKHLAPSAAQWQRLKAVDARHRIRASLDDYFPPVVTELVLRIDPLSESLLECSDKNGFRVDPIDRNRAPAGERGCQRVDVPPMCGHRAEEQRQQRSWSSKHLGCDAHLPWESDTLKTLQTPAAFILRCFSPVGFLSIPRSAH